MIYILAYIVLFLPVLIFLPTKVIHKEKMPKGKRMIVTSNHYSNFDTILYDLKFKRRFRYMAKKELFENKLLGWMMRSLGGYPVDRQNFAPSVYKKTVELLNKKEPVFIFPEGTRNKLGTEEMLKIKAGIIAFASRGEAEIIPMVMYRKPKLFRKNYVLVGDPFIVQGANPRRLTKEEVDENLQRYEKVMQDLRRELDEYVDSKKRKKKKVKSA